MPVRKVVIPVAGAGTRLLPASRSLPKEMLPVGRKPAVQYVVEEAEAAGLKQILFVTGRQKTSIEDHFDKDVELEHKLRELGRDELLQELAYQEMDVSFWFARQSEPRGLADAVNVARDFVGDEPFVVALGDSIIRSDQPGALLQRMIAQHESSGAACTIAIEEQPAEMLHHYGVVAADDPGAEPLLITDLVEKPPPEQAPSNLTIAGRYVFNPDVFDAIASTATEMHSGMLQLTDSVRVLMQRGQSVHGIRLAHGEARYDIGSFDTYFKAFVDFALADEKYGYRLRQHLYRHLQ